MSRETLEQNTVENLIEDLQEFLIDEEISDLCHNLIYKISEPHEYYMYCKEDYENPLISRFDEIAEKVVEAWESCEGTCGDIRELLIQAYNLSC